MNHFRTVYSQALINFLITWPHLFMKNKVAWKFECSMHCADEIIWRSWAFLNLPFFVVLLWIFLTYNFIQKFSEMTRIMILRSIQDLPNSMASLLFKICIVVSWRLCLIIFCRPTFHFKICIISIYDGIL